jgi:hypothetical protein
VCRWRPRWCARGPAAEGRSGTLARLSHPTEQPYRRCLQRPAVWQALSMRQLHVPSSVPPQNALLPLPWWAMGEGVDASQTPLVAVRGAAHSRQQPLRAPQPVFIFNPAPILQAAGVYADLTRNSLGRGSDLGRGGRRYPARHANSDIRPLASKTPPGFQNCKTKQLAAARCAVQCIGTRTECSNVMMMAPPTPCFCSTLRHPPSELATVLSTSLCQQRADALRRRVRTRLVLQRAKRRPGLTGTRSDDLPVRIRAKRAY